MDSKWTRPVLMVPRGFALAGGYLVLRPKAAGTGDPPAVEIPPGQAIMWDIRRRRRDGLIEYWAIFAPPKRTRDVDSIVDDVAAIQDADGVLYAAKRYGFLALMTADRREPISRWFEVAALVRAIRQVAAALQMDRQPAQEAARLIWPEFTFRGRWRDHLRVRMAAVISRMFERSGVCPYFFYDPASGAWNLAFAHPQDAVDPAGLQWHGAVQVGCAGVLAAAIMAEVAGTARRPYLCAHCGQAFVPRRVQSGRDSYCDRDDCRRAISSRAKRRARQADKQV